MLKCQNCNGVKIKPGFFDKKCKCDKKKEESSFSTYKSGSSYEDGFLDGFIVSEIMDGILDAFSDDD